MMTGTIKGMLGLLIFGLNPDLIRPFFALVEASKKQNPMITTK